MRLVQVGGECETRGGARGELVQFISSHDFLPEPVVIVLIVLMSFN